ncbi:MAG: hypothetical protein JWO89_1861 [Verrucomicrobiaceae bacterium]|nr:hypothetical protein [Verrucomicrobiaceae bacterium]MDB6118633.1 hypothetical protein [Verrucomicrobiaceae bacterium]
MLAGMEAAQVQSALQLIESESDLNSRALLLAALVSELFREQGFEPVIVGGSAIEFYTDGAYMSGDTDICWSGSRNPTPAERGEIMSHIPGSKRKGTRSWAIAGLWVDLLGELSSYGKSSHFSMRTPLGQVVLLTVEELLAERVFAARKWTGFNADDEQCARKLLACVLGQGLPCDWAEARRIAALPAYRCADELEDMRREVETELASDG